MSYHCGSNRLGRARVRAKKMKESERVGEGFGLLK